MARPPGSAGLPVIGDKSVEFYRDPIGFVNRKLNHVQNQLFLTRFLNQATVFVTSNAGVKELLDDPSSKFEMGYKQFMHGIYGDNVVFMDGEEAQFTRSVLQQIMFHDTSIVDFQNTTDRLTIEACRSLGTSKAIPIYQCLKKLTTEICLSVFLNVDFVTSQSLADDIVSLTTTHWHGLISVPLNVKLPGIAQKSSYGRAIEAKDKLLQVIESQLSGSSLGGFTSLIRDGEFSRAKLAHNHVLLFTSALVPKAIASILTSFILVTANRRDLLTTCREDDNTLEWVLLETQRLWPPFIGGRRLAKQDCKLQGLDISAGHALIYMTYHAQRDPAVFADPDEFIPTRWRDRNKEDRDKLLLFGGGSRCCVGQHLISYLVKRVAQELIQRYNWSLPEGQELAYKWLPVARPKAEVEVNFIPRDGEF